MLLRQVSQGDPLSNLVLEGMIQSAPILNDVDFYTKTGAADSVKKSREGAEDPTIFRALNTSNTATAPTPEYEPVSKKIISFDAKVDFMLEDRNEDPVAELAMQTKLEAIEAGYVLQEKIFEGDADSVATEFDGFRNLVADAQVKTVATNGLILPLGNTDTKVTAQQEAIEALLKLFATVRGGATHAYVNEYVRIRLVSLAKSLGYYDSIQEFGQQIDRIAGVIIRGAGYKKDGTPLLPLTETVGTAASKCSSIFAVRWGERINLSALTSVGVKARYAGQTGNFIINNVNMDMALVLQNDTALVQSKGWRLE